jgi:AcrR family transcriptional regulator
MVVKKLRERQADATRQLLIAVARGLFAERGYADTTVEEIIQQAGVARGALYHHFPGKDALFLAVYETVQSEIASKAVTAAGAEREPWAAARAGLAAFLAACLELEFRQIVIVDSVAVLHKDVWADPIEHIELPMLRTVLAPLVESELPGLTVEALVHVALGGLYGAALYIARSVDPQKAQSEAEAVIETIILGLAAGHGSVGNFPASRSKATSRRQARRPRH